MTRRLATIAVSIAIAAANGIENLLAALRPGGALARLVALASVPLTKRTELAIVVAETPLGPAALALVHDVDTGRGGAAEIAVGDAVAAAHGIEDERANIGARRAGSHAAAIVERLGTVIPRLATVVAGAAAGFSDTAGRINNASEIVGGRVNTAIVPHWRRNRSAADEEIAHRVNGVAQVNLAIVVGVSCIVAPRLDAAKEEISQGGDGIAEVDLVVLIGVAALKGADALGAGGSGGQHRKGKRQQVSQKSGALGGHDSRYLLMASMP